MQDEKRGQNEADRQKRGEEPEKRERAVAPPIEREHETMQGALEEDEKRRERERK